MLSRLIDEHSLLEWFKNHRQSVAMLQDSFTCGKSPEANLGRTQQCRAGLGCVAHVQVNGLSNCCPWAVSQNAKLR